MELWANCGLALVVLKIPVNSVKGAVLHDQYRLLAKTGYAHVVKKMQANSVMIAELKNLNRFQMIGTVLVVQQILANFALNAAKLNPYNQGAVG